MDDPRGNVPIPDPSLLTTQSLDREIAHATELFQAKLDAVIAALANLDVAMRQAFREKDLRDNQRFDAQSKALDAARVATELAVRAALDAAKEAVGKAEVAAEKRFDTVSEKVDDARTATQAAIAAIQAQIASMVGKGAGGAAMWGYVVGAVFLVIAVITFVSRD